MVRLVAWRWGSPSNILRGACTAGILSLLLNVNSFADDVYAAYVILFGMSRLLLFLVVMTALEAAPKTGACMMFSRSLSGLTAVFCPYGSASNEDWLLIDLFNFNSIYFTFWRFELFFGDSLPKVTDYA